MLSTVLVVLLIGASLSLSKPAIANPADPALEFDSSITSAANISIFQYSIGVSGSGRVYVVDNLGLNEIDTSTATSTRIMSGTGAWVAGKGIAFDSAGFGYAPFGSNIVRISPDGTLATSPGPSSVYSMGGGIVIDDQEQLFVFAPNGLWTAAAGPAPTWTRISQTQYRNIAPHPGGGVWALEWTNGSTIRRFNTAGTVQESVVISTFFIDSFVVDSRGRIVVIESSSLRRSDAARQTFSTLPSSVSVSSGGGVVHLLAGASGYVYVAPGMSSSSGLIVVGESQVTTLARRNSGYIYSLAIERGTQQLYTGSGDFALRVDIARYKQPGQVRYVSAVPATGSAPAESDITAASGSVTAAANTFTRTGFVFLGWNSKSDGSGTSFQPGASVPVLSGGRTLFAQWQAAPAPPQPTQPVFIPPLLPEGPLTLTGLEQTSRVAECAAPPFSKAVESIRWTVLVDGATRIETTTTTAPWRVTINVLDADRRVDCRVLAYGGFATASLSVQGTIQRAVIQPPTDVVEQLCRAGFVRIAFGSERNRMFPSAVAALGRAAKKCGDRIEVLAHLPAGTSASRNAAAASRGQAAVVIRGLKDQAPGAQVSARTGIATNVALCPSASAYCVIVRKPVPQSN